MSPAANTANIEIAVDLTIPKLFVRKAQEYGQRVAIREKEFGIWRPITWATYLKNVRQFSLGNAHRRQSTSGQWKKRDGFSVYLSCLGFQVLPFSTRPHRDPLDRFGRYAFDKRKSLDGSGRETGGPEQNEKRHPAAKSFLYG